MKYLITIIVLIFSNNVYASSTFCKIEKQGAVNFFKAVTWNEKTKEAELIDWKDKTFSGKVTLSRKHFEGQKVNILVHFKKPYLGINIAEFIVFPVKKDFRILGSGYVVKKGKRFLNITYGNRTAKCLTY